MRLKYAVVPCVTVTQRDEVHIVGIAKRSGPNMFLFNPFPGRSHLTVVGPKRSVKSLPALYRMLSEAFESRRPAECACKMPIIFERERSMPMEANWRAEALWCGSLECQYALTEVVAHHARLYDLAESGNSASTRGAFARR